MAKSNVLHLPPRVLANYEARFKELEKLNAILVAQLDHLANSHNRLVVQHQAAVKLLIASAHAHPQMQSNGVVLLNQPSYASPAEGIDAGMYDYLVQQVRAAFDAEQRKAYDARHRACPKCASVEIETTLDGTLNGKDSNRASCKCGWSGIVDELLPPPPAVESAPPGVATDSAVAPEAAPA